MARRLAGEFIGTLLLLATVVGSGIMGEQLSSGNAAIALLGNTIATGAILVVIILMFAPVSGAHFNPAVTFTFLLRREIPAAAAAAYCVTQVVAGLAGVWLAHAMFGLDIVQSSENARSGFGQWLAEGVATFGLVATILAVLRSRADLVAFAVGLYITAGTKVRLPDGKTAKASELAGKNDLLFRRNSLDGAVEVLFKKNAVELNEDLHKN